MGGAGRDLFVCGGAFGSDTVLDFHDGLDRFDLESDLGFSDLALRRLDCDGDGVRDDVRIDVAGRGVIQVLDEALGAFGAADFLF